MALLIEAAGLRAGTAAVVVVAVVVVVVAVVAVAVVVAAGREAADTADAPSHPSNGRMAAGSGAALAILYHLLPAPPGGAGRI